MASDVLQSCRAAVYSQGRQGQYPPIWRRGRDLAHLDSGKLPGPWGAREGRSREPGAGPLALLLMKSTCWTVRDALRQWCLWTALGPMDRQSIGVDSSILGEASHTGQKCQDRSLNWGEEAHKRSSTLLLHKLRNDLAGGSESSAEMFLGTWTAVPTCLSVSESYSVCAQLLSCVRLLQPYGL